MQKGEMNMNDMQREGQKGHFGREQYKVLPMLAIPLLSGISDA